MYAQVVVLTYQPPDIPAYTYKIPKELERAIEIGQLVSVPFGKRNPIGIVISCHSERGEESKEKDSSVATLPQNDKLIKIKPITKILFPTPLLLPYQIELLKWMAFYYHAPTVNCLEAMLPEIPKKQLSVHNSHFTAKMKQTVNRQPLASLRLRSGSTVNQTLILVPTINRIPETLAKYPFAKNYVIYHNELKTSEKFATWLKIISGHVDFIFGSRLAIFAPCPNLKEIIIYDEHDNTYKDERSPYFDTLTVAEKISELTGAKIKIIDSAPRVTTYFVHRDSIFERSEKTSSLIGPPGLQNDEKSVPKIQIVNMLDEKATGNRSPLSQILEDYIKLGFAKKKKILLFLNKKSESGHVYCRSCKYSDFAQKPQEICPQCQSQDVFFNSTNVNSLADLVKKIVPGAGVNIITKSSESLRFIIAGDQARINLAGTIDIATASVFYKLATHKYDLVAHIQTDSLLSIPDYTSAEKLFAQIASLKKIAKSLLLLQTYSPQNPTITSAAQGNWQKFYQSQLAERKALSYPPFTFLVKLSLKGKKEESVKQNAQKLFDELNNEPLTINHKPLTILGPYKPAAGGKLPKYNIILKIPLAGYLLKDRQKAVLRTSSLLSKVPKGTQIEVEANSLN